MYIRLGFTLIVIRTGEISELYQNWRNDTFFTFLIKDLCIVNLLDINKQNKLKKNILK